MYFNTIGNCLNQQVMEEQDPDIFSSKTNPLRWLFKITRLDDVKRKKTPKSKYLVIMTQEIFLSKF